MKGKNFQPAVAAIWIVLQIGEDLVHQIAVIANIFAVGNRASSKMPIQHHDDVGVFSQTLPELLSIGVSCRHILSVAGVFA